MLILAQSSRNTPLPGRKQFVQSKSMHISGNQSVRCKHTKRHDTSRHGASPREAAGYSRSSPPGCCHSRQTGSRKKAAGRTSHQDSWKYTSRAEPSSVQTVVPEPLEAVAAGIREARLPVAEGSYSSSSTYPARSWSRQTGTFDRFVTYAFSRIIVIAREGATSLRGLSRLGISGLPGTGTLYRHTCSRDHSLRSMPLSSTGKQSWEITHSRR